MMAHALFKMIVTLEQHQNNLNFLGLKSEPTKVIVKEHIASYLSSFRVYFL